MNKSVNNSSGNLTTIIQDIVNKRIEESGSAKEVVCVVHHIRNVTRFVQHKDKKDFCADMRNIYGALDIEAAEFALQQLDEKWGKKYPASITPWKDNWESLSTFFKYPVELRKMIYTTNRIENLNSRIKKNIKNRRQFRNNESLLTRNPA